MRLSILTFRGILYQKVGELPSLLVNGRKKVLSILKLDRSIIVKMKKEGVEREQIKMESDIVTVKRISITHKHLVEVSRT